MVSQSTSSLLPTTARFVLFFRIFFYKYGFSIFFEVITDLMEDLMVSLFHIWVFFNDFKFQFLSIMFEGFFNLEQQ